MSLAPGTVMLHPRSLLAFGGVTALVTACSLGNPTYISTEEGNATSDGGTKQASTSDAKGAASATSTGAAGGAAACATDDYVKPDIGKLTACGNGKGHCFDRDKVDAASLFGACPDGKQVCVPDDVLASAGAKPKSCTSIVGPGGCVTSALVPQLEAQGGSALKQDVCAEGQRCVPCNDPTNGDAPTPFVVQQTSFGAGKKCVPAAFVEGKPVKCKSGLLGAGVCLDACFNDMLGAAGGIGVLSREGCGTTELCIPCSFIGEAPGCE